VIRENERENVFNSVENNITIIYMSFRLTQLYSNNLSHRKRIFHTGGDIIGDLTVNGSVRITKDAFVEGRVYEKQNILLPAGTVVQSAAIVAPAGWVECDGRLLLRTDPEYKDLFTSIGHAYSSEFNGDDISFNVPDFRGRVPVGVGMGDSLSLRVLGASGGAETHTLTINEMPEHNHTGTTDISGTHTHPLTLSYDDGNNSHTAGQHPNGDALPADNVDKNYDINTKPAGAHTHTFTTDNTGGGQPHNNMQPFLCVRYIIKL
jgi:microcystin-dependent protein